MPSATANGASAVPRIVDPALERRGASVGLNYSRFIAGLAKAGLIVDRKVLSDLAIREPAAFQAIRKGQGRVTGLKSIVMPRESGASSTYRLS